VRLRIGVVGGRSRRSGDASPYLAHMKDRFELVASRIPAPPFATRCSGSTTSTPLHRPRTAARRRKARRVVICSPARRRCSGGHSPRLERGPPRLRREADVRHARGRGPSRRGATRTGKVVQVGYMKRFDPLGGHGNRSPAVSLRSVRYDPSTTSRRADRSAATTSPAATLLGLRGRCRAQRSAAGVISSRPPAAASATCQHRRLGETLPRLSDAGTGATRGAGRVTGAVRLARIGGNQRVDPVADVTTDRGTRGSQLRSVLGRRARLKQCSRRHVRALRAQTRPCRVVRSSPSRGKVSRSSSLCRMRRDGGSDATRS